MMSTNTMSGWWSAILASASKPSIAVKTSHPSLARSVSAVRRIVLLSSITRTLRPWSFVLLPVTVRQLLQLDLRLDHFGDHRAGRRLHAMPGSSPSTPPPPERGAAGFNISAHPVPCCARHVFIIYLAQSRLRRFVQATPCTVFDLAARGAAPGPLIHVLSHAALSYWQGGPAGPRRMDAPSKSLRRFARPAV